MKAVVGRRTRCNARQAHAYAAKRISTLRRLVTSACAIALVGPVGIVAAGVAALADAQPAGANTVAQVPFSGSGTLQNFSWAGSLPSVLGVTAGATFSVSSSAAWDPLANVSASVPGGNILQGTDTPVTDQLQFESAQAGGVSPTPDVLTVTWSVSGSAGLYNADSTTGPTFPAGGSGLATTGFTVSDSGSTPCFDQLDSDGNITCTVSKSLQLIDFHPTLGSIDFGELKVSVSLNSTVTITPGGVTSVRTDLIDGGPSSSTALDFDGPSPAQAADSYAVPCAPPVGTDLSWELSSLSKQDDTSTTTSAGLDIQTTFAGTTTNNNFTILPSTGSSSLTLSAPNTTLDLGSVSGISTPPQLDVGGGTQHVFDSTPGAALAFDAVTTFACGTPTYAWDFGDGTTGSGATPNHTYADGGTYHGQVTVTDGRGEQTVNFFTVNVYAPPAFTSPDNATFPVQFLGSFDVTTTGYPAPALTESGTLPSGVSFVDQGDGTAVISGVPPEGSNGAYPVTLTATSTNPVTSAVQTTMETFTLTVDGQAFQNIVFTSHPTAAQTGAGDVFAVTAVGGDSGEPVTFSLEPGSDCTINPVTGVVVLGATTGETCIIDANQAGDADYAAAPQAQLTITIGVASPAITFLTTPPAQTVANSDYQIIARPGLNGTIDQEPITFSIDAASTDSGCQLLPVELGPSVYVGASDPLGIGSEYYTYATVTFGSLTGNPEDFFGSCIIDANTPLENLSFGLAPQVEQTVQVGISQQLNTSSVPPVAGAGQTISMHATSSLLSLQDPLPVTFTLDPSDPAGACTLTVLDIYDAEMTLAKPGDTCVVDANQPGEGNILPAPQVQFSTEIETPETVTLGGPSVGVAGSLTTVGADGTVGATPVVTVDGATSPSGACTLNASTTDGTDTAANINLVHVGTCVLDANMPAFDATYAPAPQVQKVINITPKPQTITFTSTPPVGPALNAMYPAAATSTSGATPTLSIDPTTASVCSIDDSGTVTVQATGTCLVDASVPAAGDYAAATASQSFVVPLLAQVVSFTTPEPPDATVAGPGYTPATSSTSGATPDVVVDGASTNVCTLTGGLVDFQHPGTCTLDASVPAAGNYSAGTAQQSFAVARGLGAVHFTSAVPTNAAAGGPNYAASATTNTGAPITFSTTTPSICTISATTGATTLRRAGTCIVDADTAQTQDYTSASASQEFPVLSARSAGRAVAADPDGTGYWVLQSDGTVTAHGSAGAYGSPAASGLHLNAPPVGIAATPDGKGYWVVSGDGGVFAYGDAGFFGSAGSIHLNEPIVHMAVTPDGGGYWLVASDGGVFAYGDAVFDGSAQTLHLNKPVVSMTSTPDGGGYWLVANDGGVFAYGDANFYGSMGAVHLNQPVIGITNTPDGNGYWLLASDGGVFTFGTAPFYGSLGQQPGHLELGLVVAPDGGGYQLIDTLGNSVSFGSG